jgi:hypothetical protein
LGTSTPPPNPLPVYREGNGWSGRLTVESNEMI